MSKTTSYRMVLCTVLFIAGPAFAQQMIKFPIVASRGKTAVFRTPENPPYAKGDVFHVYRKIEGKGRLVAHARVVVVDKKLSGVRIIKAIRSEVLRKGDMLVLPRKKKPLPAAEKPSRFSKAVTPATTRTPGPQPRPEPLADVRPTVLTNSAKPQFGGSIGAVLPAGPMADSYAPAFNFGIQMRSSLHFNTAARLAIQYAPIPPSATELSRQNQSNTTQKTSLLMVTASLQPRLSGHFMLDLGLGYYRQQDDWNLNGYQFSTVSNALASIFGFGYMFRFSDKVSLMLLLSGNVYYPKQGSMAFLNISTAWLFGI